MPPCCLVLIQLTFFISEPNKVHHQSRAATDTTSWERQACTHDTLWRQHYIITSKEYLTNGHILTKCYELVFLQLHLVKIFVLIDHHLIELWKKEKDVFFMKHCVLTNSQQADLELNQWPRDWESNILTESPLCTCVVTAGTTGKSSVHIPTYCGSTTCWTSCWKLRVTHRQTEPDSSMPHYTDNCAPCPAKCWAMTALFTW